ncbi:MAG: hypothetical protein JRI35_07640 [Deltaproteobacteria bacterium]|nr:hypothetical protein [Deltaproteobacteria bacterium]
MPFFGFQSSLVAGRRGSAIRPAIETPKKGKPLQGRARMATPTVGHGFTEYLHLRRCIRAGSLKLKKDKSRHGY